MTDTDRIAEIRGREQAATPGPWDVLFGDRAAGPRSWFMSYPDPEDERFDWAQIRADAQFVDNAREDVPFLLAEVERLTCRHDLSSDGDEGPVVNLPGLRVVRWRCNECGGRWYDDEALTYLREFIAEVMAGRDAARTAHAALVADLRALHFRTNGYSNGDEFDCCATCFDGDEQPEPWPCPTVALLDRHAPEEDA